MRSKKQEDISEGLRRHWKIRKSSDYVYLGDRMTDRPFKGQYCKAVRRSDGKCIRGKNANMLVDFHGIRAVVLARLLRKVK